ncbi:MAG: hypothetical protein IMY70_03225, partial [Bacteroidetes bacterium]|nr:hypothetical protein [Bacteroidota bacterium]
MPVLTILPMNYDTIILGASSDHPYNQGGVFRSTDAGESWEFIGFDARYIYCMLRGSGETIYAGTNSGVYKSENLGDDWEHILPMSENVASLNKLTPDVLFAGFWGGIMRSLDNGNT